MEPGRHPLILTALIAIAIAAGIAWLAPASLLDARLAQATGGVLRLTGAQGTLWRGRGVVTDANAQLPVAWELDPWPLLQGVGRSSICARMASR